MTTDNDQAAVEALCMLTYTSDQEGEPHDCVEGAEARRAWKREHRTRKESKT